MTYYRQGRNADNNNHAQISRYQYDSKGQLVRENIFFDNKGAGFTRTYTYDKRGNITSAKTYAYTEGELTDQTPTKSYTCTYKSGDDVWEDELVNATAIDENSSLLYDANGNPVKYLELDVQWKSGRQLSKIAGLDDDGNEEAYAAFTYDENGIRTSEQSIEDSLTFDFTTEDGAITGRQSADGKNYRFIYDENGRPTAFLMNGALYHYITNQMGDVVGITDADGNLAVENFYDAWGDNYTSSIEACDFDGQTGWNGAYKLHNANPLQYRGYYFDAAIGMYYLQSRYFNPMVNRFFNADDPDIAKQSKDLAVGMNLFAYCNNDPVNGVDPSGKGALQTILDVFNNALDTVERIVDLIAASSNKSVKQLTNRAKYFNKAKRQAKALSALTQDAEKLGKKLGRVGFIITAVAIISGIISCVCHGGAWTVAIVKACIDLLCEGVSKGVSFLAKQLAKLLPAVGFIVGIVASIAATAILTRYFNDKRVNKITNSVCSYIRRHGIKSRKLFLKVSLKRMFSS